MKLINKRLYTYVLYKKKVKEKQTEANLSLRYHTLTNRIANEIKTKQNKNLRFSPDKSLQT